MRTTAHALLGLALSLVQCVCSATVYASPVAGARSFLGMSLAGIPLEFILFSLVLSAVAFSPRYSTGSALSGAFVLTVYKTVFSPFDEGAGLNGLAAHFRHEWVALSNLLAMLLGFTLLSKHFENSHVSMSMRHYLAEEWTGGVVLLIAVFGLASFLDNIAAAMIGGTIARAVFGGKVHIGYLAAIVAASNAGGSGSVVGDTTTTMMWIAGIAPHEVFSAYVAAGLALLVVAVPASLQQHAFSPIVKNSEPGAKIDWMSIAVVGFILFLAIGVNLLLNLKFNAWAHIFPFLGLSIWLAILLMTPVRTPDWLALPNALRSSFFLLSLVWCASMMPVEALPPASWAVTLAIGFVSAVFDNIPLTALALKQGGFDWGFLAYAVGFGGSLIWFGSSAGVALANMFPEAKSVRKWLLHGWHVTLAYIVGYFIMLWLLGWRPGSQLKA